MRLGQLGIVRSVPQRRTKGARQTICHLPTCPSPEFVAGDRRFQIVRMLNVLSSTQHTEDERHTERYRRGVYITKSFHKACFILWLDYMENYFIKGESQRKLGRPALKLELTEKQQTERKQLLWRRSYLYRRLNRVDMPDSARELLRTEFLELQACIEALGSYTPAHRFVRDSEGEVRLDLDYERRKGQVGKSRKIAGGC